MTNRQINTSSSSASNVLSFRSVLSILLCALLVLTAAGGFYMFEKKLSSKPDFAVLNLNKVVSANETILASKGLKPEELSVEAKLFARRMKTEIDNLQKNCGCTLLVSSAVISPSGLPDMTDTLLERLGFTQAELVKAEVLVAERMKALQTNFPKGL